MRSNQRGTRRLAPRAAFAAVVALGIAACDQFTSQDADGIPHSERSKGADTRTLAAADPTRPDDFKSAIVPKTDESAVLANDKALAARVKAALASGSGSGQDIEVSVSNGVASLHGAVASGSERARAEALAAQVPGVRGVNSHLVVVKGS